MSNNVYGAIGLTGGTAGFLDAIDGTALADKDIAIVVVQDGETYHYALDADSAKTEVSPFIIAPDANGGNKRWIRHDSPPNRNAIINGAMDIWQRGTATLTNPAAGTYFPDRFQGTHLLGDGTYNLLQSAETVSIGFPFQYSLKLDCTHLETAVAAGEYAALLYKMEGYDFKRLEGETATLSFWVKAIKTGIYCVAFSNSSVDKSYVHEFTVNTTNTWEKKTITLTFNSGGTFLYTTGVGLYIVWTIMCGSTFQIATANKDTWQAGNYYATDAQVNGLDNAANNFWLTGVQMELGAVATPFELRSHQEELARCQRYYYRINPGVTSAALGLGFSYSTTLFIVSTSLPVPMRIIPTALEQNGTANNYSVLEGATQTACSAVPTFGGNSSNITATSTFTVASGLTVGRSGLGLTGTAAAGYLGWSAEL